MRFVIVFILAESGLETWRNFQILSFGRFQTKVWTQRRKTRMMVMIMRKKEMMWTVIKWTRLCRFQTLVKALCGWPAWVLRLSFRSSNDCVRRCCCSTAVHKMVLQPQMEKSGSFQSDLLLNASQWLHNSLSKGFYIHNLLHKQMHFMWHGCSVLSHT